ncbi:MAG TPA: DUF3606 domain-containing protein [Puia sp.]|nr:DUF3606 domain-containing protein [Puia sp.]
MTDNKKKKGAQDRARVSANEPYEVEYLHSKYPGLSHQQVYAAVRKAGPSRTAIIAYLKDKGKVR